MITISDEKETLTILYEDGYYIIRRVVDGYSESPYVLTKEFTLEDAFAYTSEWFEGV